MGQAARVHSSRQAGGHARQARHDAQSGGCWRGRSCAQATGQGWAWEGAECSSALRKDERWWERAGWESRETRAQGGKKTTEARVPAGGRPPTIPFLHVSVHFPRSNGHSPGRSLPSEHRRTLLAAGNSFTSFPPICVTSGPVRHSAMQTRGVGRRWQDGGHLSLIIRRRTTKASSLDPLLPPPQPPRIIDDDAQQSPPSPPVSSLCRPKTPCLSSSVS